jgi:hypothetical protein
MGHFALHEPKEKRSGVAETWFDGLGWIHAASKSHEGFGSGIQGANPRLEVQTRRGYRREVDSITGGGGGGKWKPSPDH